MHGLRCRRARSAGIRSESDTTTKETAKRELLRYLRELYATLQASRSVSDGEQKFAGRPVALVASHAAGRTGDGVGLPVRARRQCRAAPEMEGRQPRRRPLH